MSCVALQLARLKETVRSAYERVPHYRQKFDAAGVHPDDLKELADLARFPVHHQGRPAAELSLRHVRGADGGDRAHPCVERHDRQADRGRLHARRHRHLGAADGALDPRRRRPRARQDAHRLWLRPVHRRTRLLTTAPNLSARRSSRSSGGFTERQVQLINDFKPDIIMVTPSYMLAIADEFERQGLDAARVQPAHRHLRRRAVDRAHAGRDRAAARASGARHLRPVGGDRPGRRRRNAPRPRTA